MATYTKTGTVERDDVDLFTISGVTVLPVNGDTFVFDGLAGTDTLTLNVNNSYPYLGAFLSTNFVIPAVPDAFGQYVISGTIMSDIMVTLKLTSVEQLVFADKRVSLSYPGAIDDTPPTVITFNPPGIQTYSIKVTFSEEIQRGTGYIALRGDDGYGTNYNVATSPNLTISGSTITITPTTALEANKEYSVTFGSGSIQDMAGNGCSNDTEYHFNTNSASNTLPSPNPQIGFGKVATDFGGGYEFATSVTTQPDGKILVAGASMNGSIDGFDVALVRYNADGSLDTSFGGGDGRITTDFGYGDMSIWVSALSDGKILVIGQSVINGGSYGKGILARYNTDGTLDTSFDSDGKVITMLDGMSGLYFGSGIVQNDEKIVVVGVVYTENSDTDSFVVLRYNSDGHLDTSFDTDGVAIIPVDGSRAQCVVQQSDGKILVAGTNSNGVNNDIVLARYNVNGSLDISFNGNGIVITDFGGNEQLGLGNIGGGVAVNSDGKIFVAGQSDGNFVLLRYNSDGILDTSFSGDGKVIVNLGYPVQPYSLVVQPDGKILVSGGSNTDVMLLCFNQDGTLDSTFFDNGKVTANIGGDLVNGSGIFGSTLQADGKILVAGQSNGDMGVVRFNADGTLDTTFGLSVNTIPVFSESRAGTITTDFGGVDTGRSVIEGDGKILVAGTSAVAVDGGTNYNLALARYTTDGTSVILDPTFGNGGKRTTDFGGNEYGRSVVELSDGKFLLAGSTTVANGTNDFVLACYNGDGTLDSTFASNGKVTTDFSSAYDIANSIKVLSDGKILLAGTSGNNFAVARYNSNGTLDTTFYGGGKFTTDFSGTESGMSVTMQSDGKLLVAGTSILPGGNADFALVRYNADGTLDTTFHGDGKLTTDFGGTESGQSVVVQSDGKIIVAGSSIAIMDGVAFSDSNFALVRYNTDGSLDTTFHGNGGLTTDFGATTASGSSVILQSDGKILVAGSSTKAGGKSDFALARYNTDGTLDASFHGDGRFTMDFGGSSDTCYSISVQADGKILVGGTSDIDGNGDFALARINTDGSLDATFGGLHITPTYTVNGTPIVIDHLMQIDDGELSTLGNYAGATLTLMRHGGAVAEDHFSNTGTLGNLAQGSDLVIDSVVAGTIITNAGGVLEIGFNGNATQPLVNEVLQQIAYSNSSHSPAFSIQVDWLFSDGNTGAQGSGGAMTATYSTTIQTSLTDTSAPILFSSTPSDNAAAVAVNSNIVLTFSEYVQAGSGNIVITDGTDTRTININDGSQVTIAGNTVTINPTDDLHKSSHYHVEIDNEVIKDLANNAYAGTTTYDFTTIAMTIDFDGTPVGTPSSYETFMDFVFDITKQSLSGYIASFMTDHDIDGTAYLSDTNVDGIPDSVTESWIDFQGTAHTQSWIMTPYSNDIWSSHPTNRSTTDISDDRYGRVAYDAQGEAVGLYVLTVNPVFTLTPDTVAGDTVIARFQIAYQSETPQNWTLLDNNLDGQIDRATEVQTWIGENNVTQSTTGNFSITWSDATHFTAHKLTKIKCLTFDSQGRPTSFIDVTHIDEGRTPFSILWLDTKAPDNAVATSPDSSSRLYDTNGDNLPDQMPYTTTHPDQSGIVRTGYGVMNIIGWTSLSPTNPFLELENQSSSFPRDVWTGTITGTSSNPTTLEMASYFMGSSGNNGTDTTNPTVTAFSPADAAMNVPIGSDITLTFSEDIQFGSGAIEIHAGSPDGTLIESYDVATSSNLSIEGNTLTINPTQ